MNRDPMSRAAQRALRTELACARALLDELEAALDAERTPGGVALQVAEQFVRVANAMSQKAERSRGSVSEPRHEDSFEIAPPTD